MVRFGAVRCGVMIVRSLVYMAVARLWACFSGGIPQFVVVAAVVVIF